MSLHRRHHRAATLAVVTASLLTACTLPGSHESPQSTTEHVPATTSPLRQQLTQLQIAPEDTAFDYDRGRWPHWSYVGNGCDIRDKVLIKQGTDGTVREGCQIVSGTWVSPYDGVVVHDPDKLDIDHRVPLSEVADSRARDWTKAQREYYANDMRGLVAVTAHSNRSKGGRDPSEWLPEQNRCSYVQHYITVKIRYRLTIDAAEHTALVDVIEGCSRMHRTEALRSE